MNEDYYKILGVNKSASGDEIKKAYIKLAHKYHPDKSGGDEKKFKEINEAYQTLSNPEKRSGYDRFGKGFSNMGAGGGAGFEGGFGNMGGTEGFNVNFGGDVGDLQDILEGLFGGNFGMGGRSKRRTYKRGGDLEMDTAITLEEAKAGKKIETKFETVVECSDCKGMGHYPEAGFDECSYCNGRGEVKEERRSFLGNFAQIVSCKKCHGAGKIPKKPCKACDGKGKVKGLRNITVEVRPGVEDGQIIKIKGMGEAGEHGTEAGDLYVRVHVKPNPHFERRGNDIYVNFPISIVDAMLGRRKEIKNLGGKAVHFEIPAGFNLKDELRIRGEGMTSGGDLVVRLEAKTPKHISAKAKKLLEDLETEL